MIFIRFMTKLVTMGTFRRALHYLNHFNDPGFVEEPEPTQEEIKKAYADIRQGFGKRVIIRVPTCYIEGQLRTFWGGCEIFYFEQGRVCSKMYSPEDLKLESVESYSLYSTAIESGTFPRYDLENIIERKVLKKAGITYPHSLFQLEHKF